MANDRYPDQPRNEPEIIPPGRASGAPGVSAVWMRFEHRDGTRRVYIGRPSLPAILLGLVIIGVVAALAALAIAGLLIVWIPILIGGIALAFLSNAIRRRWYQFRVWLAGGR
jgi:hypothetical protein